MNSVSIFGVRVDDIAADETSSLFLHWLNGATARVVVTPNPEFILLARQDAAFCGILNRADLSLPDGVGLRFAVSALTEETLRHRSTGIDALRSLAELCAANGKRLLLLGGSVGAADAAADALRNAYANLDCVSLDPGVVVGEGQLSPGLVAQVLSQQPAVLAVALGQGKQEQCIVRHLASWPSVRIAIGVGGAFDTLSGKKPRAPEWLRVAGLEWVWRLAIEPRRFARIFRAFPVFPLVVVWATLRERRFLRACRRTIPEIFNQVFSR